MQPERELHLQRVVRAVPAGAEQTFDPVETLGDGVRVHVQPPGARGQADGSSDGTTTTARPSRSVLNPFRAAAYATTTACRLRGS